MPIIAFPITIVDGKFLVAADQELIMTTEFSAITPAELQLLVEMANLGAETALQLKQHN